jgi:hypothetical protein
LDQRHGFVLEEEERSIVPLFISGEVYFYKNNGSPRVVMHVDISLKLWAYFDIYGSTQKIRILGQRFQFAFIFSLQHFVIAVHVCAPHSGIPQSSI